jgi:hypothetical protein
VKQCCLAQEMGIGVFAVYCKSSIREGIMGLKSKGVTKAPEFGLIFL